MPSLNHLLASYDSLLLLDAASARVQVGWFERRAGSADAAGARGGIDSRTTARWQSSDEEAGIGVFRSIEALGVNPNVAAAFAFCDGPGSILGIRTIAMALRTWCILKPRPIYAYASLAVVAHALGRPDVGVIADARRDSWHQARIGAPLRRVPTTELSGELAMPEHFRHWSSLPDGVQIVPYSLAELLPRVADADLFLGTDAPDAFLHEEPSYVTWTPQIHRAPNQ